MKKKRTLNEKKKSIRTLEKFQVKNLKAIKGGGALSSALQALQTL